jgi:glutathione S-transferase
LYAPSVIEPAAYAHNAKWDWKPGSAGWGRYEDVLESIEHAIGDGPYLLGERFTMADVIFGGTVRYMIGFKMIEPRPRYTAYVERLSARPAAQAAQKENAEMIQLHGLGH